MNMQYKATRTSTDGSHYLQGFVEAIRKVTSVAETTLSLDEQRYLSLIYHKLTWVPYGRPSAEEISDIVTRLRKLALTAKSEYVIDSHLLIIKDTAGHIVITVNAKKGSFFPDVRFATPTGDAFKLELTKGESPVRPMRKELISSALAIEKIHCKAAREKAIRVFLSAIDDPEMRSTIGRLMTEHLDRQQLKANVDLNKDAGVMANGVAKDLLGMVDANTSFNLPSEIICIDLGVSEPGMANALNSVDGKHCPTGYVVRKRLTNHTNLTDFAPSDVPYKINFEHVTSGGVVKTLLRDIRKCRWDRIVNNALAHADISRCADMWFAFKVGFTGHGPFAVFWIDQLNHQCYARMIIGGSVYEISPTI